MAPVAHRGERECLLSGSVFCTLVRSELLEPLKMEQVEAADLVALPPCRSPLHGCWEAGEGLVIRERSSFGDSSLLVST